VSEPWTCPGCGDERAAADDFCGRCGRPRPRSEAVQWAREPGSGGLEADPDVEERRSADLLAEEQAAEQAARRDRSLTIRRALVLNVVLVVAVVGAVLFGRGAGPAAIDFDPASWRCGASPHAWTASLPGAAEDLRVEWRRGGVDGPVASSLPVARAELEVHRAVDGRYRVPSDAIGTPECELAPGTWTMAVVDASTGQSVATGALIVDGP
jgi:hypothetical protein